MGSLFANCGQAEKYAGLEGKGKMLKCRVRVSRHREHFMSYSQLFHLDAIGPEKDFMYSCFVFSETRHGTARPIRDGSNAGRLLDRLAQSSMKFADE